MIYEYIQEVHLKGSEVDKNVNESTLKVFEILLVFWLMVTHKVLLIL